MAKLKRWYRSELRRTGIPHILILGQAIIPFGGQYANGSPIWERDMARLRAITADYRKRLETEQQAEELRAGPEAKVAHVIYSTG